MPSEIDQLMLLDPLDLSDVDLDKIVDYLRGSYKTSEASAKAKRTNDPKDIAEAKVDLVKIGLMKAPVPLIRRKL